MRHNLRWVAIAGVLALAAAGCGDSDEEGVAQNQPTTTAEAGEEGPAVEIASPADGTAVKGNVVNLDFDVEGLQIVMADGDKSGRTGHLHVFIDRNPVGSGQVIPVEAGIVHTTDDPLKLSGLKVGRHTITVVLGDGAHTRIGDAADKVTVNVEGPAVDATAPATAAPNQPVNVDAVVEGVQLAKADGDVSGRTGHLHVFIDRDPTPAGQPIPVGDPAIIHSATSPISLPALAPGAHTIWVVVGNGAHVPLDPPVMDKLTITVQ